jgi:L-lysine 2,3-aminomutase
MHDSVQRTDHMMNQHTVRPNSSLYKHQLFFVDFCVILLQKTVLFLKFVHCSLKCIYCFLKQMCMYPHTTGNDFFRVKLQDCLV